MRRFLALPFVVAVAAPAHADSSKPAKLKEGPPVSIQGYGAQNPACLEWTDGCVLCIRAEGRTQCSTTGIACVPAGLTCKRTAK